MKLIATIRDSDLFEGVIDDDPKDFRIRTASRAVVFDDLKQIALLKVNKHNYYKLPGGGIEEGEDAQRALARELLEEIGCKTEVIDEVGETVQYLNRSQLKQISYCYLAKQIGQKNEPNFEQSELDAGFEVYWAKDIDEAITLLSNSDQGDYRGASITKRDLAILIAAKDKLLLSI